MKMERRCQMYLVDDFQYVAQWKTGKKLLLN